MQKQPTRLSFANGVLQFHSGMPAEASPDVESVAEGAESKDVEEPVTATGTEGEANVTDATTDTATDAGTDDAATTSRRRRA